MLLPSPRSALIPYTTLFLSKLFTNAAGCDSIATLHFTVTDTTKSDTSVTRCSNQLPYSWNAVNYSADTVVSKLFTNAAGCDSIATLHFTVTDTTKSDTVVTRCSNQLPYSWKDRKSVV